MIWTVLRHTSAQSHLQYTALAMRSSILRKLVRVVDVVLLKLFVPPSIRDAISCTVLRQTSIVLVNNALDGQLRMIKKGSWLMLRQGHMVGYLLQEQRVHCGSSYLRNGLGMLFAAYCCPILCKEERV